MEDTGAGIGETIAPQLFQPFVTSKQTGMGIGLSICRTIVEAHGGRIWFDARESGGTAFHFTANRGSKAMSDETRLVHLVDDDEAVRRSVGFMLKTSGFQVRAYDSGIELLKAAASLESAASCSTSACPAWTVSRSMPRSGTKASSSR